MSPSIGNFVHDLVEMAKATEALPVLEADNGRLQAEVSEAKDTIAAREVSIISLKQQIEQLQETIRRTEAERDDAELRFLDADSKAAKVLDLVRGVQGALVETVVTLDPPKPEPVPEPAPVASETATEPHPFVGEGGGGMSQPIGEDAPASFSDLLADPQTAPPEGERAPDPTPAQPAQTGTGTESGVSSSSPFGASTLEAGGGGTEPSGSGPVQGHDTTGLADPEPSPKYNSFGWETEEWKAWYARQPRVAYGS